MIIKGMMYGVFAISIIFASCLKKSSNGCSFVSSNVIAPDSEVVAIKDSLFAHGITTATLSPLGFYYIIDSTGSGTPVSSLCSTVSVTYKGRYFDGTVFDSTAANSIASFQLGQVIVGWQKALPLISKGGVITLYIPPSLAYGPNPLTDNLGNVLIPGKSYLVFDVHLVDIQ